MASEQRVEVGPTPPPGPSRAVALTALGLLATLFLGLGLVQAWRDAPTFDEPVSLAAGLTALTRHDLRLNTEHPPLAKALSALPALLAHPDLPEEDGWDRGLENRYTEAFVDANEESGKLRATVFLGRLVPLALAVTTGFALYALGARLGGRTVGLVAGASWLTLPPVLGYGHIAGLDIPFSAALVLTALVLDRHLSKPTFRTAALVGLASGACLLVRTTGLIVLAVAIAVVAIGARRRRDRVLAPAAVVLGVAWLALWGGYRVLAPTGSDLPEPTAAESEEPGCPAGTRSAVAPLCNTIGTTALDLMPLPAEYEAGLASQEVLGDSSDESFVLGRYSREPSAGFWPASLAVKLPPTVAALAVIGAVSLTRVDPRTRRRLAAILAPGVAVALTTVLGARPLGVRYLLPLVAVMLLVGASSVVLARRVRPVAIVVAVALIAQLGFLVNSAPHSLAWVSPPFGHPWRVASDSNVDWGQDWYLLHEWARDREGALVTWIGPMEVEPIPGTRGLLGVPLVLVRGWVAVNATSLTVYAHDELAWLRAYCPVGDLGGSVLLYYFEEAPTWRGGAPDAPAEPCDGDVSVRVA